MALSIHFLYFPEHFAMEISILTLKQVFVRNFFYFFRFPFLEDDPIIGILRPKSGKPDSGYVRGSPNGKKVQVGKDQEKAQSEKDSHSKNRGGKKPN